MRVVDPEDGRELHRHDRCTVAHEQPRRGPSPDGSVLVTAGSRGVVGWDLERRPRAVGRRHRRRQLLHRRRRTEVDQRPVRRPVLPRRLAGPRHRASVTVRAGHAARGDLGVAAHRRTARWCSSAGRRTWSRAGGSTGSGPSRAAWTREATPTAYNADGTLLLTSGPAMRTADDLPSWLELTAISADSGEVAWRGGDVRQGGVDRSPGPAGRLDGGRPRGRSSTSATAASCATSTATSTGSRRTARRCRRAGTTCWAGRSYDSDESAWAVWDLRTGEQVLLRTLPVGGSGSLTRDGRLRRAGPGRGRASRRTTWSAPTRPSTGHGCADPTSSRRRCPRPGSSPRPGRTVDSASTGPGRWSRWVRRCRRHRDRWSSWPSAGTAASSRRGTPPERCGCSTPAPGRSSASRSSSAWTGRAASRCVRTAGRSRSGPTTGCGCGTCGRSAGAAPCASWWAAA